MLFNLLAHAGHASPALRPSPHGPITKAARLFEPRQPTRVKPADGGFSAPLQPDTVFAIIACQRSGTHLLRHILNSSPEIAVLGEAFSHAEYFMCWHNFVRTLPKGRFPPMVRGETAALVDEYVHAIQRDVHRNSDCYGGPKPQLKMIGLDIKYEHVRCVGPLYSDLRSPPFLFDYFRDRSVRLLHLIRRNIVHTAISIMIANIRGVWHNYDGATLPGAYRISPAALFHYIQWINSEREEFLRLTQDLPMHTFFYEDLVADIARIDRDGVFPDDATLGSAATFLNVTNRFGYVPCMSKVINRPYCEILENYDQLRRAIQDSVYSEFADTL